MLLPTLIFRMWSQLSLSAWAYNTACHCWGFISSMSPASILFCWHYCIPVVNLFTWHKWIYSYHKLFKYLVDLDSKFLRGLMEVLGLWGKCAFIILARLKEAFLRTPCGGFNDGIPGNNFEMWVILWKNDYFVLHWSQSCMEAGTLWQAKRE